MSACLPVGCLLEVRSTFTGDTNRVDLNDMLVTNIFFVKEKRMNLFLNLFPSSDMSLRSDRSNNI